MHKTLSGSWFWRSSCCSVVKVQFSTRQSIIKELNNFPSSFLTIRWNRNNSTDPDTLERLRKAGIVVPTPCKSLPGQRSICYDDRMILELAENRNAAIISNDNYSDLLNESDSEYLHKWKKNCIVLKCKLILKLPTFFFSFAVWDEIIRERVVGFTFCDDLLMIPQDPYGRNGRPLQLILHKLKDDAQVEENTATNWLLTGEGENETNQKKSIWNPWSAVESNIKFNRRKYEYFHSYVPIYTQWESKKSWKQEHSKRLKVR